MDNHGVGKNGQEEMLEPLEETVLRLVSRVRAGAMDAETALALLEQNVVKRQGMPV